MKKIIPILLTLLVMCCYAGCGGSASDDSDISSSKLYEYTGTGDDVTDEFHIEGGTLVTFTTSHTGESNFIVWLLHADTGENETLVTNEIGNYSGETADNPIEGDYVLEVTADGDWTIRVDQE